YRHGVGADIDPLPRVAALKAQLRSQILATQVEHELRVTEISETKETVAALRDQVEALEKRFSDFPANIEGHLNRLYTWIGRVERHITAIHERLTAFEAELARIKQASLTQERPRTAAAGTVNLGASSPFLDRLRRPPSPIITPARTHTPPLHPRLTSPGASLGNDLFRDPEASSARSASPLARLAGILGSARRSPRGIRLSPG